MQQHDPARTASRQAVVISPNSQIASELEPLLTAKLAGIPASHMPHYPSPREISAELGGPNSQLVFLDVASDADQAMPLLTEIARMGGDDEPGLLVGHGNYELRST